LKSPDSTVSVLLEGYEFVSRRRRALGVDVFRGRLLGRPTVFMAGPAAAQLFYDESNFRRADAVPSLIQKTLFGQGGVQGLDGAAHRERKALFMRLMTRESLARFLSAAERSWLDATARWERTARVVLFDEARLVLCRAACDWVGVPVSERRLRWLARASYAMVDGFATLGPRVVGARVGRIAAERWARGAITAIRSGARVAPDGSAARVFAEHRQSSGEELPVDVAAVELLNLIRPTTAIAWWVAFMALALRHLPEAARAALARGDLVESFVQEVRRYYPFTPLLAASARQDFEWRGVRFREGDLAVLDVYGTLRDPHVWPRPNEFLADRFLGRDITPFDLIPSGGGEHWTGHRCAGEWLTIEALRQAALVLTQRISYELPPQDFRYSLSRVPTRPNSGVILERVRALGFDGTPLDVSRLRGTVASAAAAAAWHAN
jgi:fatty-acid peroxygenase